MGFGLTFWFRETVFGWLIAPANGLLSPHEGGLPVYTSLTEPLGVTLKVSFWSGLVVAFPVAVLSIYFLARPKLSHRQRRTVAIYLPVLVGLFLAGNAFSYWVILPAGIQFLVDFADGMAVPTIRISEYTKLALRLIFFTGLIFEIPAVMFVLAKARIVTHERFTNIHWLIPFAFSLIFGGLITPSFDIPNMLMIAVPIYVLWRFGLLMAWLAEPGNGSLMLRFIKRIVVGILRRVAVVLVLVPSLAVGLIYVIVLSFVFVWDGHLSSEVPSRRKAWVDRVYARLRGLLAKVSLLRKGRPQVWVDCYEATAPERDG